MKPQLSGNQRGCIGAGDLFLGGDGDDQIAGLGFGGLGDFLERLGAEIFFQRRGDAFGRDFNRVHAARAQRFRLLGYLVNLFARKYRRAGSDEA